MNAVKGILSKGGVCAATNRGKRYARDLLDKANRFSSDADKVNRLKKCECTSCFYLIPVRIGGAAMTGRECAGCDTNMHFSSTAVDLLCKSCGEHNGLCVRCGADLELKERRSPYPFEVAMVDSEQDPEAPQSSE
jgi:predicted RNA-binding Zn-ribbon protein involved in translation (DUF1610 family)